MTAPLKIRVPAPVTLLFVEDDPADAYLVEYFLKRLDPRLAIERVSDGEAAIVRLSQGNLPDIVILDLNLPKQNGFQVLRFLRRTPCLRTLPVVILTTSECPTDMIKSYELDAAVFMRKSLDVAEMEEKLTRLVTVEFPRIGIGMAP